METKQDKFVSALSRLVDFGLVSGVGAKFIEDALLCKGRELDNYASLGMEEIPMLGELEEHRG